MGLIYGKKMPKNLVTLPLEADWMPVKPWGQNMKQTTFVDTCEAMGIVYWNRLDTCELVKSGDGILKQARYL